MRIGERKVPQRDLRVLAEQDDVLASLVSLRDDLMAQATSINSIERVLSRRSGRANGERKKSVERKLYLESLVVKVIGRADYDEIAGGTALRDELEASIEAGSYARDKIEIAREAIEQGRYGSSMHPGMYHLMREITFGDTMLPLERLIDSVAEAEKKRREGVELRKSEQEAHEDYHFAYLFFDELTAALRRQAPYVKTSSKGMRGGMMYDIALDVVEGLNKNISYISPGDAFFRRFDEVSLDFMKHNSYLAAQSMVMENERRVETSGTLVNIQQALIDVKRKKEMKLEAYR